MCVRKLITRRSRVRIPPPLPHKRAANAALLFLARFASEPSQGPNKVPFPPPTAAARTALAPAFARTEQPGDPARKAHLKKTHSAWKATLSRHAPPPF